MKNFKHKEGLTFTRTFVKKKENIENKNLDIDYLYISIDVV